MATEGIMKMMIHYNPSYDGEVFLGDAPDEMGVVFLGNRGLLDFLALRAGIHPSIKSDVEREADYHNAMTTYLGEKHEPDRAFFRSSAAVDPLGVARRLLQWRDNLLMAGWYGECTDDSCTKLVALADIETYFRSLGMPDWWQELHRICCCRDILGDAVDKIIIDSPWSDIPNIIRSTFSAIKEHGHVAIETSCSQQPLDVSKISLMSFQDIAEAYEWLAQVDHFPADTMIVNRDNVRLNHTLSTWNKPLIASSLTQSNPQLLQLFKLSMSIFSRPLNIYNLVSYLQLPMSPIPSRLRRQLARILLKNGGFGEKKLRDDGAVRDDWDEAIANYVFLNEKGKPTPQARANKLAFLSPIRADFSEGIDKVSLADYITHLQKWLKGFNADKTLAPEIQQQLHELDSQLSSFSTTLMTLGNKIQYADIEKILLQVYRPMSYKLQHAESGSLNVVTDVSAMARPCNTLIWLDCQQEDAEADAYGFLSTAERDYLKAHNVDIPDFASHLEYRHAEQVYKLNQAGRVILVRSAYDGTTRLGEHSIVAEALCLSENKLTEVSPDGLYPMRQTEIQQGPVEHYTPSLSYDIGPIDYKGREESYSSIEKLISFPFNYVMDFVAQLPDKDEEQVNNPHITVGLVAHHFFQHIVSDGEGDLEKMRHLTIDEFDYRLTAAIHATGLILLLPENAARLNSFRNHLAESMLSLIAIMEYYHLTPVGCEMNFPEQEGSTLKLKDIGPFGARIDFVLQNETGDYVIFDFKWSYGKKYKENLENDQAIQLELYRQAVEKTYPGKKVVGVGYYLMPRKQLITTDFKSITGSKLVVEVDKPSIDELADQIRHSYAFRMDEIRRGHIEEAETMDVLPDADGYYCHQASDQLFPLEAEEKASGRGASKVVTAVNKKSQQLFRPTKKPSFEKKDLTPSEIATSHPVLKGRLK